MKLSVLMLGLCVAAPAHADMYKYIDASGRVTYTNQPIRGAQLMYREPAATPAVRPENGGNTARKKASANPAPIDFPRVNTDVQRKRDNVRRNVLEDELHAEELSLADAVAAKREGEVMRPGEKASSPGYITRTYKLDSDIKLHRDNINALRRELSSVK